MQSTSEEHCDSANVQTSDEKGTDDNQVKTEHTNTSENAPPQLSAIELRVLGVLMEKQLTTPDQYPLTLNSVTTACNQKSSREPISSYNQGEVHRALQALDNKKFVRKERSSRSEKFSQQFTHHLELGRNHQALLCVMMLRGPQTVSELNTRTQRMHEFSDKDELEHCIDRLCNRQVPYAIRLEHQPGQRGERITHLFSGTPTVHNSIVQQDSDKPDTQDEPNLSSSPIKNHTPDDRVAKLESEVAALTENIKSLRAETTELKQQVAALSKLSDNES